MKKPSKKIMIKKIMNFATLIMIIITTNTILAVKSENLEINIELEKTGGAKITENYKLSFISEIDSDNFKKSAIKNGSSFLAWQAEYEFIKKHINAENLTSNTTIAYEENTNILTLSYVEKNLAELTKQEQRADYFKIDEKKLSAFNERGSITIPENTKITITLPPNSEVITTNLSPKVKVFGNQIILQGITSNSMTINYILNKPIIGEGNDIIKGVPNAYIIIAIATIIIILIHLNRDEFEKKIEEFIVEHSEIKAKRTSEEIDFDLD
jgi:hypothetical protein